ncbi:MAG TPA: hypothetical protein VNJ52_08400 [Patescibacteria group bacterium]|nr:hypothetical protein [Patescibacteria group bacterium]
MKRFGVIGTTALFLLAGFAAPAGARQQDQGKSQKQGQESKAPKQKQSKPQGRQRQATKQQAQPRQQQQRQQATKQQSQRQQQARTQTQQRQQRQQPVAWQKQRATNWQSQHRTWRQRGGYNGYRIPTNDYNQYYGQNHMFRINTLRVVYVGSYPRFQYGGFWFSLVDPWPQYWANNWYDNDEMYIAYYGDGYYLFNRRYPRDRIAITFYLN